MAVAVRISGNRQFPGVETTFTENVSEHGARLLTSRRWKRDDLLTLEMLNGGFCSIARVTYCRPVNGNGFAVGVELKETRGDWVIPHA
jgi:hypothetical protein